MFQAAFYRVNRRHDTKERAIMRTVLIVLFILLLIGALPAWPHSINWGYGPSGGTGLVLLVLLVLVFPGRLGGRKRWS